MSAAVSSEHEAHDERPIADDDEVPAMDDDAAPAPAEDDRVEDEADVDSQARHAELDEVAAEIEAAYTKALAGSDDAGPRALTDKVVSASLSGLGHNAKGRVVFTTATLTSLSLGTVDVLAQFKYLQKILLDNNAISDVTALSKCDSLVHVSLSNNRLTSSAFQQLQGVADTLQYLDVSNNQLTSLDGVDNFKFLNTLLAEGNAITTLQSSGQVSNLSSLWRLSLASNKITSVEQGAFANCPLRLLDLSKNELHELDALADLTPTLTVLGLEDNALMHLADLVSFGQLSTLGLAGNNLYDMGEVHKLAKLRLLRNLTLIGNPLCSFGAMPDAPIDEDDASDIVCRDDEDDEEIVKSGKRPVAPNVAAAAVHRDAANSSPKRVVPTAIHATALNNAKNAPFQPRAPVEADAEQLAALSEEQRYRLHIVWRVPHLSVLDGVEVTGEEAADATNLVGGADRESRASAEKLLSRTSGAAAAGSAVAAARGRRGM